MAWSGMTNVDPRIMQMARFWGPWTKTLLLYTIIDIKLNGNDLWDFINNQNNVCGYLFLFLLMAFIFYWKNSSKVKL